MCRFNLYVRVCVHALHCCTLHLYAYSHCKGTKYCTRAHILIDQQPRNVDLIPMDYIDNLAVMLTSCKNLGKTIEVFS